MSELITIVKSLPLWVWAVNLVFLSAIAVSLGIWLVLYLRHKAMIMQMLNNEISLEKFLAKLNEQRYKELQGMILKLALKYKKQIPENLELDSLLIKKTLKRPSSGNIYALLQLFPERGLFPCFRLALEKKRITKLFLHWLEQNKTQSTYRLIALSGKGENFSGEAALSLLNDHLSDIRELVGDPEWAVRYFAYKILVHDTDKISNTLAFEAMKDSYSLIRKMIIEEIQWDEKQDFYKVLMDLFLHDPVYEVRHAAKKRIHNNFRDLYTLDTGDLESREALHVLELLEKESSSDINIALSFLLSKNLELRFAAAYFLNKTYVLENLLKSVSFEDLDLYKRNKQLLLNAVEVNICDFLSVIQTTAAPAVLKLGAELIMAMENKVYVRPLAEKALKLYREEKFDVEYQNLYKTVSDCVFESFDDSALFTFSKGLKEFKKSAGFQSLVLTRIKKQHTRYFSDVLISFMKDETYSETKLLMQALQTMYSAPLINEIYHIIKAPRERYPHKVRIFALEFIGKKKYEYMLDTILESLPTLPLADARAYADILSQYKDFSKKVEILLADNDASIRAALISALPKEKKSAFVKEIRSAVKDSDPEVRIAAIWALVEISESKSVNQSLHILRDPVERVRISAAKAIGQLGSDRALEQLAELVGDEHEVDSIKFAALTGLGVSGEKKSIEILINLLKNQAGYKDEIIKALQTKTEKRQLQQLLEALKDETGEMREELKLAFFDLDSQSHSALLEILREDIPSLQPIIFEILEKTGFLLTQIKLLKHRNASVRKNAAEKLSLIRTKTAFRGMVLAARDPDEDVRIMVIKALEFLDTKEGKTVLEELKNDTDRKVRKYVLWALERIKAKNMSE